MTHADLINRLLTMREARGATETGLLLAEAADALEAITGEEAVERGARALWYDGEDPDSDGVQRWEDAHGKSREDLRHSARAVLDAAVSDPHSPSVTTSDDE